jgi:hypothetical protein
LSKSGEYIPDISEDGNAGHGFKTGIADSWFASSIESGEIDSELYTT